MHSIDVREETVAAIEAYAGISPAFRVERRLVIPDNLEAATAVTFRDEGVPSPFVKDYDALPDNHPTDWVRRLDTAHWRVLAAFAEGRRVGGAILVPAHDPAAAARGVIDLWDLRVDAAWRRRGVARTLWAAIEAVATAAGASELVIETQHNNVAACQFYRAHGCELVRVDRSAYPELPEEILLGWRKVFPGHDRATSPRVTP